MTTTKDKEKPGSTNSAGKYHDQSVWDMNAGIGAAVEERNVTAADLAQRAKAAAEDHVTSDRYAEMMAQAAQLVAEATELLAELPGIHRHDNERDYRHEAPRPGERQADVTAATDL